MYGRAWNRWRVRVNRDRANNQVSVAKASSPVRANRVSRGNPDRARRKVNKDSRDKDKDKPRDKANRDKARARVSKVRAGANQEEAVAAGNLA